MDGTSGSTKYKQQQRFPAMRTIRPPRPTVRDEEVARVIARRIIAEINGHEDYGFYWADDEDSEIEDRIADVQREIMRCGRPATVTGRLYRKQPPIDCKGTKPAHPWGWEGIDEHCRAIGDRIAKEELAKAMEKWEERYL